MCHTLWVLKQVLDSSLILVDVCKVCWPVRKGLLGLRRQEICCLAIRQSSHLGCALGVFLL
jgi:hypothetical protein